MQLINYKYKMKLEQQFNISNISCNPHNLHYLVILSEK